MNKPVENIKGFRLTPVGDGPQVICDSVTREVMEETLTPAEFARVEALLDFGYTVSVHSPKLALRVAHKAWPTLRFLRFSLELFLFFAVLTLPVGWFEGMTLMQSLLIELGLMAVLVLPSYYFDPLGNDVTRPLNGTVSTQPALA